MNTNFKTYAFITLFITAFTFATNTFTFGQKPAEHRIETFRKRGMTPGPVSAASQSAYQIGKDFAMAVDDSKTMKDDGQSFNFTIVDLVYLIDELEGQAEAAQLQSLMKSIIRGQKDQTLVSSEIAAISNTYLNRQTAEQKWFFNVGTSQMRLVYAGWAKVATATAKHLKDLQLLTKSAPDGTPRLIIEAINGLTKYATLNPFTVADYGEMVDDAKMITTLVYA